jgi:glycerophosphoryl diester phosphodiesterase
VRHRLRTLLIVITVLGATAVSAGTASADGGNGGAGGAAAGAGDATVTPAWTPLEQKCLDGMSVIAHRGTGPGTRRLGRHRYSEDTVPAFQKAVSLGACGIEADFRQVRGGVVSMHDPTLNRMTRSHGSLRHQRIGFVTRLRTPSGARVPDFTTVQTAMAATQSCFQQQELKAGSISRKGVRAMVRENVALLKSPACVLYTSTSLRMLRLVNRIDPSLGTGWIDDSVHGRPGLDRVPRFVDRIMLDRRAVDARYVRAAHRRGLEVSARSVETRSQLRHLARIGVRYVVTDRPWALAKHF